ncbi:MAG: dicarboxylate/amino acid:cation symporter [Clostridium sp.]|nr:dicarboxylate/amino acid:cation symporter [Clostridium sp.]
MKKLLKDKTSQIMFGLCFGVLLGVLIKFIPEGTFRDDVLVGGVIEFLGTGFINLIKMTVVPLVFVSLVCGMSTFGDAKKLGRVGSKVLGFYLLTTAVAITLALGLGLLFKPGSGLDLSHMMQGTYTIPESQPIVQIFLDMIPTNPIKSMAEGNMLQVIVFAVIIGLAINLIGEKGEILIKFFDACNDCIMKVVSLVMSIAPIGVCALITRTVYSVGFESLLSIAKFIGVVALGMIIHAFFIYGTALKTLTKLPVKQFLKSYSKVAGVTFSTSSSNAALPLSMESMDDLGVGKSIYSFSLPLGATINMDGTAIMQGVAVIFIAQVYNIDLSVGVLLSVIITAVLASVGTAGVPGVGMITLAMVLQSANLPLDGIALIIGFDRILDMMRTTVNVMGDCVCSLIVAKSEEELDIDKYMQYAD